MSAIRIIRETSTQPGVHTFQGAESESVHFDASQNPIDRAEQLQTVSDYLASRLSVTTPNRIDSCWRKLQSHYSGSVVLDDSLDQVDVSLHASLNPLAVHSDLSMSRILELLED